MGIFLSGLNGDSFDVIKAPSLRIGSDPPWVLTEAAGHSEFPDGRRKVGLSCSNLVGVVAGSPADGLFRAFWSLAHTLVGEFEPNNTLLKVLVVPLGTGELILRLGLVLSRLEVLRGQVVAICLRCGQGRHERNHRDAG